MSLPAATVRYICGVGAGDAGLPDAELLGRFIDHRDEAAFALLVRRHGDMVYGVCRRLLPTEHDAEDAFQATCLILAEKARSVAPRAAVGNWLYGVARRAALLARRSIARRRERMTELTDRPAPAPDPLAELRSALDTAVCRLPDSLRTVVVLCDLEERTRKEAAAILGWPEGTVAGRLVQARRLLAKRLARHAPGVSVAAILAGTVARAPAAVLALVPPEGRVIPASVAALTRAVLANMAGGKLMKMLIAVLVLGCAGVGMSLGAGQDKAGSSNDRTRPAEDGVAAVEQPAKAEFVAWGDEVDGLQAGLSLVEVKTERAGDTLTLDLKLEVKVRNVGKAPVTITYGQPWERWPTVIDAAGKEVAVKIPEVLPPILLKREQVIEPGKTVSLSHPHIVMEADSKRPAAKYVTTPTVRVRPGTYTISYGWVADSHKTLDTGALPFKKLEMNVAAALVNEQGPRATAEMYSAAALAGRIDEAIALAVPGSSPANKERIAEFAKRFDAKAIRFPYVYAAADEALAMAEDVKLAMAQPDGTDTGCLAFTLVKSGGRWLVKDIDFRTASSAAEQVESFKKRHPTAASVTEERIDETAKKIRDLRKERIAILKQVVDQSTARFQSAQSSYDEVLEAQLLLLQAELDAAETEADRIPLYLKTIDALKECEQMADKLVKIGRGTPTSVLKIKARRLEVEIQLEQAKGKVAGIGRKDVTKPK